MGWNRQNLNASGVGAGPYTANYNRSYDTHTEHGSNSAFAVNPPAYADVGPYEYSGRGNDPQVRAYHNPENIIPDVQHGSQYGYLGDTIGPREIQTGNAPSGGYATLPFSYTVGFQQGALPDNRRMAERNRSDDWHENQYDIYTQRDAERRSRRAGNVSEDWVEFDPVPFPVHPVNAIEDSPYRKDWPDGHQTGGMPGGSATWRTNPNTFRNLDRYDYPGSYAISGSRYMNGTHYSMAVHQTLTPYGPSTDGANPVRVGRNTYRMEPAPWDTTNTDGPSNTPGYSTTISLEGTSSGTGFGTSSYMI
jgi:hypothetical protein